MKRKFTLITAALALLMMMVLPERAVGQDSGTITFDFEDNTAHRTSGSNSYSSTPNNYTENSVEISLTYADAVTTGTPLNGSANVLGRVAKNTTNSPVVLLGPISISNKTITKIEYNTKGVATMSQELETSLDNSTWTSQLTISSMPTSNTKKETNTLSITGTNLYVRITTSVSSSTTSNRDLQIDDIVISYTTSGGGGGGSTPTVSIPTTPIEVPSTGGSGNLDITYSNMDISDVDQFDVVFYDTDGVTPLTGDDIPTWVGQGFSGNDTDGYKFTYNISNYTGATNQVARLKVYALDDDYTTEAYSDLLTITQTTPPTYTVTYNANGGSGTMTDTHSPYIAGVEVTLLSNTFIAPEGKEFDSWLVKDADDGDVTVTAGKFTMPAKNVTVTAQWVVDPDAPQYEWVLTSIGDLTGSDVFVIVGTVSSSSTNYAMTNDNGTTSAPVASTVTIANGKLSDSPAANLRWNISGNSTDGYTFYPNGDDENWLYCNTEASSSSNNNLRVGTGSRNLFINSGTTFKTKDDKTDRYLCVYTGTPDWRGYISNSTSTTTTFYKRQEKTTEPSLYAENVNIACEVTAGAITYTLENPVSGGILTAAITAGNEGGWLTLGTVGETVPFTCTANTGAIRTATVTLTYTYNTSETKTATAIVTQSAIDFATMPFDFDDGKDDFTTGLTGNGLGSDYGSSPKLKFDNTGDYLILKLNAAPTSLSYDIKGNGFSGGTFKVQTSADGETYTDLATYTSLGSTQSVTHLDLVSTVRYIMWVYTNKSSGNVALGNIHASTAYNIYGTATTTSLAPTTEKKCTIYNGGKLTVSGTLTNNTAANLVIEDGGQLVTSSAVAATVQKSITAYVNDGTGSEPADGWYFIASPVAADLTSEIVPGLVTGTYDLYYLNEANEKWINYKNHAGNIAPGFKIKSKKGYLYANSADQTIEFSGVLQTNATVTLDKDNNGWNLIGNPFTCNAYSSKPFYWIENGLLKTTENNNQTPIPPCTGIIVEAASDGESFTFSKTAPDAGINNGNLNIVVAEQVNERSEAKVQDNAILSFNEGDALGKFSLNNGNAKIFFPQYGKDYAIATSNGQGEMPLNFVAAKNGQYTLTVNAENVEMNYLHLIDNLTGADIDLLQTPSYTFNGKTTDYASRFRLVFSANNVNDNQEGNTNFAYINGEEIVILNAEANATLQVVDLTGRIVSSTNVAHSVSTAGMVPGVYVLRLINGTDVKVQKIIVE